MLHHRGYYNFILLSLFYTTHYDSMYKYVTQLAHHFLLSTVKILVKLSAFYLKHSETTSYLGLIPLPGFHHL